MTSYYLAFITHSLLVLTVYSLARPDVASLLVFIIRARIRGSEAVGEAAGEAQLWRPRLWRLMYRGCEQYK